jgi:hypothetical protein
MLTDDCPVSVTCMNSETERIAISDGGFVISKWEIEVNPENLQVFFFFLYEVTVEPDASIFTAMKTSTLTK